MEADDLNLMPKYVMRDNDTKFSDDDYRHDGSLWRCNEKLIHAPLVRLLGPGVSMGAVIRGHNRLTTLSARPLSPRTMLSLPAEAIFSRTSSSRSRMRVGLSASSLADRLTGVDDLVSHDGVEPQRDLVGGHDLLTADIDDRLPPVDFDHLGLRWSLPEGVFARLQGVDVPSIDEEDTHAVALDRADIEHTGRQRRTDNQLARLRRQRDQLRKQALAKGFADVRNGRADSNEVRGAENQLVQSNIQSAQKTGQLSDVVAQGMSQAAQAAIQADAKADQAIAMVQQVMRALNANGQRQRATNGSLR